MGEFVKVCRSVCRSGEVAPGVGKLVETGGKRIALFNVDGTLLAIDDTCTHRGGPLPASTKTGWRHWCS